MVFEKQWSSLQLFCLALSLSHSSARWNALEHQEGRTRETFPSVNKWADVWLYLHVFICFTRCVHVFISTWIFIFVNKCKKNLRCIKSPSLLSTTTSGREQLLTYSGCKNIRSSFFLTFCWRILFPCIKYKCGIYTSKLGQLHEPLVILVTADPYGHYMNDLTVVCKLH